MVYSSKCQYVFANSQRFTMVLFVFYILFVILSDNIR